VAETIFLIICGVGLGLTLVTFILGELFEFGEGLFDGLGDVDIDVGGPDGIDLAGGIDAGASPFSSRILFVAITAFGGFGFIALVSGAPMWAAVLIALAGAIAVSAGTFFLVVLPLARQQGSTHVSQRDFLDLEGQVTSSIPAAGLGQVVFVAPSSGARVVQSARSEDGQPIPSGTAVRVVQVSPSAVTVSRVDGRTASAETG
jgi:hypothetical protein